MPLPFWVVFSILVYIVQFEASIICVISVMKISIISITIFCFHSNSSFIRENSLNRHILYITKAHSLIIKFQYVNQTQAFINLKINVIWANTFKYGIGLGGFM